MSRKLCQKPLLQWKVPTWLLIFTTSKGDVTDLLQKPAKPTHVKLWELVNLSSFFSVAITATKLFFLFLFSPSFSQMFWAIFKWQEMVCLSSLDHLNIAWAGNHPSSVQASGVVWHTRHFSWGWSPAVVPAAGRWRAPCGPIWSWEQAGSPWAWGQRWYEVLGEAGFPFLSFYYF